MRLDENQRSLLARLDEHVQAGRRPAQIAVLIWKNQHDFDEFGGGYKNFREANRRARQLAVAIRARGWRIKIEFVEFDRQRYELWLQNHPGGTPAKWAAVPPFNYRLGLKVSGPEETGNGRCAIGWAMLGVK